MFHSTVVKTRLWMSRGTFRGNNLFWINFSSFLGVRWNNFRRIFKTAFCVSRANSWVEFLRNLNFFLLSSLWVKEKVTWFNFSCTVAKTALYVQWRKSWRKKFFVWRNSVLFINLGISAKLLVFLAEKGRQRCQHWFLRPRRKVFFEPVN